MIRTRTPNSAGEGKFDGFPNKSCVLEEDETKLMGCDQTGIKANLVK